MNRKDYKLKESIDGIYASSDMVGKGGNEYFLEGSFNFIMEFLEEWGIAPTTVKTKNGINYLYDDKNNEYGYCDEEGGIISITDKEINYFWKNNNPSVKRVNVIALTESKKSSGKSLKESSKILAKNKKGKVVGYIEPQKDGSFGYAFGSPSQKEVIMFYVDTLEQAKDRIAEHSYDDVIFESKKSSGKSLLEEINRSTWSNWKIKGVHHIEYFFNGKVVNKKTIQSLFEDEGFDTDVDTVENEIYKAVIANKLGNLDGNAIHIAHNSVGNRIDLVFDIEYGEVQSLSTSINECVVACNGSICEMDELWNFGFRLFFNCRYNNPFDFALTESKKSARKSIKESSFSFVIEVGKGNLKLMDAIKNVFDEFKNKKDAKTLTWKSIKEGLSFSGDEDEVFAFQDYLLDHIYEYGDYELDRDYVFVESKKSARKSF